MRFRALSIISIFVLSIALPMISAAPVIKNEFEFYQTEVTLHPGLNETTAIPHFPGYRSQSATLDWELSPESQDFEETVNVGLNYSQLGTSYNLTGGSVELKLELPGEIDIGNAADGEAGADLAGNFTPGYQEIS